MKKPKSDDLLKDFAEEIKILTRAGVQIGTNNHTVPFEISMFICDTLGRAYIKNTRYFNHTHGCGDCDQQCARSGRRAIYSDESGKPRTDDSFKERRCKDHHQDEFKSISSVLEKVDIGHVTQFPLDPMHMVDLGVVKKMLSIIIWRHCTGGPKTEAVVDEMSFRFVSFAKFTPIEFARRPRDLADTPRFKATEFRQIVLYTGIILFKEFLDKDAYEHFLKLSVAYRILSSNNWADNIETAERLLGEFVKDFHLFYGINNRGFNVHNLLHLPKYVRLYGKVSNFSAYPFENYIGKLNKMIRGTSRVLEQVSNISGYLDTNKIINMHKFHYDTKSTRNSTVILKNGLIGVLKKITAKTITISSYQKKSNYFTAPIKSYVMGIYSCRDLSEELIEAAPEDIVCKCYAIRQPDCVVVLPILL